MVLTGAGARRASSRSALALGAESVAELPRSEGWLVERLTDVGRRRAGARADDRGGRRQRRRRGDDVRLRPGPGGRPRGGPSVVVDADPLGPGVDRVLGLDLVDGVRWDALGHTTGRLSARSLRDSLPRRDGRGRPHLVRRAAAATPPGLRRARGAVGRPARPRHGRGRPAARPPTRWSTRSSPAATRCWSTVVTDRGRGRRGDARCAAGSPTRARCGSSCAGRGHRRRRPLAPAGRVRRWSRGWATSAGSPRRSTSGSARCGPGAARSAARPSSVLASLGDAVAARGVMRRPSDRCVEEVRERLARDPGELTPHRVAEALRASGRPVGDATVLAVHEALRRDVVGAGPLEPLLRLPDVTDVLVNGPDQVYVDRGRRAGAGRGRGSPTTRPCAGWPSGWPRSGGRRLDDATPARRPPAAPTAPGSTPCSRRWPGPAPCSRCGCRTTRVLSPSTSWSPPARSPTHGARLLRDWSSRAGWRSWSAAAPAPARPPCSPPCSRWSPADRAAGAGRGRQRAPPRPPARRRASRPGRRTSRAPARSTLRTLVRQALRMRPDRLVVGEVRGAEVVDLLAALNTGHEGGCGTIHANSARDVPARVEALALAAGLGREAAHSQLLAGVDAVLHLGRDVDGRRVLREVAVPSAASRRPGRDADRGRRFPRRRSGRDRRRVRRRSPPGWRRERRGPGRAVTGGAAVWLLVPGIPSVRTPWPRSDTCAGSRRVVLLVGLLVVMLALPRELVAPAWSSPRRPGVGGCCGAVVPLRDWPRRTPRRMVEVCDLLAARAGRRPPDRGRAATRPRPPGR